MKMSKVSKVIDCSMADCAYNTSNQCHAMAITVGSECPMCDTYVEGEQKGGLDDAAGGVGACKMASCKANVDLECTADGIHVQQHGSHPDCASFTPRQRQV
ncbi:MAG: DUF1540 domain-containing protein [Planctomycetota bacterium]|jgi:hypothetical protein